MFWRVMLLIKNQTFMKKALIAASAAIILAAGAAACWAMYSGSEDEFFNENLEALMDDETGSNTCYKDIHDKDAVRVFYCGTCSYVQGQPDWLSSKGRC